MSFMGTDGFVWFQGVVEDRADPLFLGRCRVRCLGYHTENKTDIPTESLPWAMPIQPVTSAAISGIGHAPIGPVEGTWVVGFFRDGLNCQEPVFFGTLGGIPPESPNTGKGFNDPNGVYPKQELLKEQDTNRLARGLTADTIVQSKIEAAGEHKEHATANEAGDHNWAEPETPFDAKYPKNHVYQSESGHVQEFDDTEGAERIHTYHKAGTFEEIHPDGSKVIKVIGDDYELLLGKKFVHVSGNANILVDGQSTFYVKGDSDIQVDGNVKQVVGGNVEQEITGNVEQDITGNFKVDAATIEMKSSGSINIETNGNMVLKGTAGIDLN
tara:strand:+ start:795 stop:1775 length:981 start_codon:yes stop_codon:yes gene_type:complete